MNTVQQKDLEKVIKSYRNMKLVYIPMFKKLYIMKNGKQIAEFASPSGYEDAKKEFIKLRNEEIKKRGKTHAKTRQ